MFFTYVAIYGNRRDWQDTGPALSIDGNGTKQPGKKIRANAGVKTFVSTIIDMTLAPSCCVRLAI